MSSHSENDTRFLTQPRPPSFYDLKITAWAVGALVLISFASSLSPVAIVWILAAALVVQVVVELLGHEQQIEGP